MAERTSLSLLLKRYRAAAGLSQEALAQRADLSTRAISDLERGLHRMPHTATLELLASALALSEQQRALLLAAARPELPDLAPPTGGQLAAAVARGLPSPPTALIGRERELVRAADLLQRDTVRLVTLTGPSGVGKTRLALQVAHEVVSAFADGAVFVDLASIRDPSLVPSAVAQTLSLREKDGTRLDQQVISHLREQRMLLVLDNFEQIIEAALFVAELLTWCPHVTALVTSRAPLRLRGEQILQLAPLSLEDAIVLFRERAHAVRRDDSFAVSEMAAVCERLDCLPLAIELAASQVALLRLPKMLERLNQRMPFVLGGARDLPARQQTMEAAIGWGYELLTPAQQRCLRALSVFVGGATLAAACAVCWGDGPATESDESEESEAMLTLAALVDASLVQAEMTPEGFARFHLLELVREFAGDRLRAEGEEGIVRRRHVAYFAGLAETMMVSIAGVRASQLARELPNARAALEWAVERRDATMGLRLAGFPRVWSMQGMASEAEHWLSTTLALDAEARKEGAPTAPLRLRVERLYGYARTLLNHGHLEQAEAVAQEAQHLAHEINVDNMLSEVYATLGMIAQAKGDTEQAASAFRKSVAYAGPESSSESRYRSLFCLAEIARNDADFSGAHTLLERALDGAEAAGNAWDCAIMTTLLAHVERQQRDFTHARRRYLESLERFHGFGSSQFFAWSLEGLCALLCEEAKYSQAARLCAAADALRQQAHAPLPIAEREAFDLTVSRVRAALGDAELRAVWDAGKSYTEAMALADAVAYG